MKKTGYSYEKLMTKCPAYMGRNDHLISGSRGLKMSV